MKEAFTRKSLLILGRGIGQVMFQNNALSGLLMLIGIFLNSWQMGLLAVSGNIISTLTARISGYDCDDIKNGLYGFNGTLVGIAVGVFMLLTVSSLMLMAIASCASTYIARFFNMQRVLPGFTTPFILSVWMLLGLCSWLMPDMLLVSDTETPASSSINYLQCFSMGIGQVMFQGNMMTGLFFLAGILVNSRNAAVYTILGALLPLLLATLLGVDSEALNMGLMGYNGVLCALALGGKSWMSCIWAACSVLLSVVLQIVGMNWGIITLTAPFVLSVWLTMGIKNLYLFFKLGRKQATNPSKGIKAHTLYLPIQPKRYRQFQKRNQKTTRKSNPAYWVAIPGRTAIWQEKRKKASDRHRSSALLSMQALREASSY